MRHLGPQGKRMMSVAFAVILGSTPLAFGSQARSATAAQGDDKAKTAKDGLVFEVTVAPSLLRSPTRGRLYIFLIPGETRAEPRFGPNWFRPQPFFAIDVDGWKPEQMLRVDSRGAGYPGPLNELKRGKYTVQAVFRVNPDTHRIGDGEGNAYGPLIQTAIDPKSDARIPLVVDRLVAPRKFPATDRLKLAELESPILSEFHQRPIKLRAAVILPPNLPKAGAKLPVLYIIPGFGGDHFMAQRWSSPRTNFAADFIRVVLDPDCGTGHHVFADSATNGPRGKALVEEFIPYIERTFGAIPEPRARLLNGHSSGGWSSLWLQASYPDFFGGTWSTSPDPVDFRDVQQINIYRPQENMFLDGRGTRRPIARMGNTPALFYDEFSQMDDVIGWGGQLGSFEAVFSPLGPDGRPRKLWDRSTGRIDPEVARAWERYDIRLVLERNWPALGPKLKGKLHVIMGGRDTFYLEGAVRLLKESLTKLGSDAVVEIIPDKDHGTVMSPELAERFDREMKAAVGKLVPADSSAPSKSFP
jgi:pimeloyl-ACP methyl ester carboxylesterase